MTKMIKSNMPGKRLITFFAVIALIFCSASRPAPAKAENFEYFTPIYNFPDTGSGQYQCVFNTYLPEWQGFHLAIDMKRPAGTLVASVLDGSVVGCGYMQSFGDKNGPGGAVIIAHQNKYGETFYALYGHLKELEVSNGDTVAKGQIIGKIMELENNYGVSNPHLHFGINTQKASFVGNTGEGSADGFVDPYIYLEQTCKTFLCTVTTSAQAGGTVSASGTYENGETATLIAAPNKGYLFDGWYENDEKIEGADANYSFIVKSDRTLEARFTPEPVLTVKGLSVYGPMTSGDPLYANIFVSGGTAPYKYAFYLLKDGEIVYKNYPSQNPYFTCYPPEAGTYTAIAYCIDKKGTKVSERQTVTIRA
ncbi:MAG: peptidoglycan DD-metalloendopeptidase family protein [Clostridia bacterium]|nr:peptidoglycan DD-metalloendopeptidase family protein [Clostridia bacterium]